MLKTKMKDGVFKRGLSVTGHIANAEHDAAYAHELVEAISLCGSRDTNGYIMDKADELMAEWGCNE